jgi:hypothetical protein
MSPVFSQHLYQGVFDDLNPSAIPDDIDLFNINQTKYPLLKSVEDFI